MRFKSILLLVLAMICGMTLATVTSSILPKPQTVSQSVVERPPMVGILAVNDDVSAGKPIPIEKIVVINVLEENVPNKAVTSFLDIAGSSLKRNLTAGAILRDDDFSRASSQSTTDGFIPPGHQAISVQINDDSEMNVQNFEKVKPGDVVDVLLIKKERPGKEKQVSTLLENITVLATKIEQVNLLSTVSGRKYFVSLLLNKEQANTIYSSQETGKLRLRVHPEQDSQDQGQEIVHIIEPAIFEDQQITYQERFLPRSEPLETKNGENNMTASLTLVAAEPVQSYAREFKPANHVSLDSSLSSSPQPSSPQPSPVSQTPPLKKRPGYSSYYGEPSPDGTSQWITLSSPSSW